MLDQNTDKLWYVIGAVLIGAAIILILNGTVPDLFGQVAGTYEEKTEEAVFGAKEVGATTYKVKPHALSPFRSNVVNYDEATNTYELDITSTFNYSSGFQVDSGEHLVPYGHRYELNYDLYIPEQYGDKAVKTEINNDAHGVENWMPNDQDPIAKRKFSAGGVSGEDAEAIPVNAGEWTHVTASYVNTHPENTEQADLIDRSRFGVLHEVEEPLTIYIRNVQVRIIEQ